MRAVIVLVVSRRKTIARLQSELATANLTVGRLTAIVESEAPEWRKAATMIRGIAASFPKDRYKGQTRMLELVAESLDDHATALILEAQIGHPPSLQAVAELGQHRTANALAAMTAIGTLVLAGVGVAEYVSEIEEAKTCLIELHDASTRLVIGAGPQRAAPPSPQLEATSRPHSGPGHPNLSAAEGQLPLWDPSLNEVGLSPDVYVDRYRLSFRWAEKRVTFRILVGGGQQSLHRLAMAIEDHIVRDPERRSFDDLDSARESLLEWAHRWTAETGVEVELPSTWPDGQD